METAVEQPANPAPQSSAKYDLEGSYLVFSVNEQLFALPHHQIISILDLPRVTKMPGMADHAIGVMDFMGKPVTVYEFRKILGVQTHDEETNELVELLQQRKQDHLNWLTRLKTAVNSGTEITVETNPHKCAFGKWYDSFQTGNPALKRYLNNFDTPHQKIHNLAVTAKQLMSENNADAAVHLIRETENNELSRLIVLFDGVKTVLQQATAAYVIVLQADDTTPVAIVVDEPKYFGQLDEITYPLPKIAGQEVTFADAYGTLTTGNGTDEILIVDIAHALGSP